MLELPADSRLLLDYLRHFRIDPSTDRRQLLHSVISHFSVLPYENLTKILKHSQLESAERSRRSPAEVLQDHIRLGAGGTCFSLTATLLHLVRSLGWTAQPILADRRYGQDTHCALLVWMDDCPHLVDPGYLIIDPIPLEPRQPRTILTGFNRLLLEPRTADRWDLSTIESDPRASPGAEDPTGIKYRLTFKTQPADPGQFLRAWNASFAWDMMQYPLLTRVAADQQLYLHGGRLQIRSHDQIQRVQLSHDQLAAQISSHFGIDPRVVQRRLRC